MDRTPRPSWPTDAVDRDHLLTNVMLYWLIGTAGSSAGIYYENMHAGSWGQSPSATPTGVAVFAEDVAIRRYAERGNNIAHWSEFDRGGHFAAMEAPDLLVGDVRTFFRLPKKPRLYPCTAQRLPVGVLEEHIAGPGGCLRAELLDVADGDAAAGQGLTDGVDVLDDQLDALDRAGLAQRQALAEHHRAGRAGRSAAPPASRS